MILIACVDGRNGMAFNRRRQSRDRAVRAAEGAFSRLEGIRDAWPEMRTEERRMVLASVVESVTIDGEYTDIKLKFGLTG